MECILLNTSSCSVGEVLNDASCLRLSECEQEKMGQIYSLAALMLDLSSSPENRQKSRGHYLLIRILGDNRSAERASRGHSVDER